MKELTITNYDALNIAAWNAQLSEDKLNAIPLKIRYYLKKLITQILPDVKDFEDFRDNELKNIQSNYMGDDKSYDDEVPKVDSTGNVILNEDGSEQTEKVRKIKEEFINDYQADIDALNKKLMEILYEKVTYTCHVVDMEEVVSSLPDDTPLEFEDINMLDIIFSDNGEA